MLCRFPLQQILQLLWLVGYTTGWDLHPTLKNFTYVVYYAIILQDRCPVNACFSLSAQTAAGAVASRPALFPTLHG